MAPNGTTSRKAPSVPPRVASEDSSMRYGNLFEEFGDALSPRLKGDVKENLPVVKKPGSWDTESAGGPVKAKGRATPSTLKKVPPYLARAFPNNKPMSDQVEIVSCKYCKRPVIEPAAEEHVLRCQQKKQEKQRKKKEAKDARDAAARKEKGQDSDEEQQGEDGKTASKTGAGKKRKAIDEGDEGVPSKKKKKKDELKAKANKPKAPVDVEKQCGVELPQGGQCARSLTCKSHSMGAKRAVPGRSAPYDKLLMEYQRKNQAKMQKAAMDANAPNPDDENLSTGPIDEEEEKDAVMAALARNWGGAPLYERQPEVSLSRKYERNRIRGMLASATSRGGGSLFGTNNAGGAFSFFGSSSGAREPTVDAEGIVAKKPSVVPGARSMMAQAVARKPSAPAMGA